MGVWEFGDIPDRELDEIAEAVKTLNAHDIHLIDEAEEKLNAEINERKETLKDAIEFVEDFINKQCESYYASDMKSVPDETKEYWNYITGKLKKKGE